MPVTSIPIEEIRKQSDRGLLASFQVLVITRRNTTDPKEVAIVDENIRNTKKVLVSRLKSGAFGWPPKRDFEQKDVEGLVLRFLKGRKRPVRKETVVAQLKLVGVKREAITRALLYLTGAHKVELTDNRKFKIA